MIDMTNEIFYMEQAFLKSVKFAKEETDLRSNLGAMNYIKEFNTLELRLPRRCGKTKYIETFKDDKNAIVFLPRLVDIRIYVDKTNVFYIGSNLSSHSIKNFNFIYLDEISSEQFTHKMVDRGMQRLFTYDTVIVSLLTK